MAKAKDGSMPKHTRVEVFWVDIVQDSGWLSPDDLEKHDKAAACRTIGYVEKIGSKKLYLRSTISGDGDGDITIIPIGCIMKVRRINAAPIVYDADDPDKAEFLKIRRGVGRRINTPDIPVKKVKDLIKHELTEGE